MREIKFRAWDKDYKYMKHKVMVGNVWDEGNYHAHMIWVDAEDVDYECESGWMNFDEHSNIELMQYTGLKDKNGVEIYEGDIVRFTNSIDEIYNEVGKVTWEQSECNFVAQYKTTNCVTQEENGTTITIYLISNETYRECVEYEVIGNIYENPELLEREAE